jgi:ferric-dicitrate binding protein FerR (iron transport regulator)
MAADPARERNVEQLRRVWEAADDVELRGDVDRGWAALSAGLDAIDVPRELRPRTAPVLRLHTPTFHRHRWSTATRIAAAVLVAVGLGAGVALELGRERAAVRAVAARNAVMREVTTRRGQQANVYLSDGTHVVLGVASVLRFPTAFDVSREVELDGEAYFEVAHEDARPFLVHTTYGTARDIGTKFAVRAYDDLPGATVTVTEGSVLITASDSTARRGPAPRTAPPGGLLIEASDVGTVSADGELSVARGAALEAHLAWMSGRLVFDQMPVAEAIDQINRWYDSDVRIGDPELATLRLTASLGDEPVDRAIAMVATALDARVAHSGSTFTLYRADSGS